MCRKSGLVLMCFILFCSAGVMAQERIIDSIALSVKDVGRLALQNNFDIQLVRFDMRISKENKDISESIYDVMMKTNFEYENSQLKSTLASVINKTETKSYDATIQQLFPTGTTVSVSQASDRTSSDAAVLSYSPIYNSLLKAEIDQALGRNFLGTADRAKVKITLADIEKTQYASLDKIEGVVEDVLKAYWDLVLANQARDIRKHSLDQAKHLFELNQERIISGLAEQPDLLGAEANYRFYQSEMVLAEENVESKLNALRLALNISDDVAITPSDSFERGNQQASRILAESLATAFENRADYKSAEANVKKNDLTVVLKKNSVWPEVNLKASFSRNGIGDQWDESFNRMFEEDNPEFYAGISVKFPFGNRQAKAEARQADLAKAQALLNLKYLERKVAIQIIDQIRKLNVYQNRLTYLSQAADLQERKLEEQEKIFRQGRSDSDTVIRFQGDALTAQLNKWNAYYDLIVAQIELDRREGVLLKKHWDENF